MDLAQQDAGLDDVELSQDVEAQPELDQPTEAEKPAEEPKKAPESDQPPAPDAGKPADPAAATEPGKETGAPAPAKEDPALPADAAKEPTLDDFPPLAFQGDGKPLTAPGSHVADNGVWFDAEKGLPWLKQQLAIAAAHNGSWQRELRAAKAEGERLTNQAKAREAAADVIVEQINKLAEGDLDAAWAWFEKYRENLPRLLADARSKEVEERQAQLDARENASKQEREDAELGPKMVRALDVLTERYLQQEPFKHLDAKKVRARLGDIAGSVFYRDADKTVMVNYEAVEHVLRFMAEDVGEARKVAEDTKKAADAGKANAAAVEPKKAAAPAIPSASGAAPARAAAGPDMPKFKNKKEQEEWLAGGGSDRWMQEQLKSAGV